MKTIKRGITGLLLVGMLVFSGAATATAADFLTNDPCLVCVTPNDVLPPRQVNS